MFAEVKMPIDKAIYSIVASSIDMILYFKYSILFQLQ